MYFARNLRYLRERAGERLEDLAGLLSVSAMTVSRYERGETEPDMSKLLSIADHFSVSADRILRTDLGRTRPIYAANLHCLRMRHRMSQEDTARLIGLKDKSSICLVENGRSALSIEQAVILADFFGITLDRFLKQDLTKEE